VAGIGEQGERSEPYPGACLDERIGEREDEGDLQRPAMAAGGGERGGCMLVV
jgi:hypothetical protein